MNICEVCVAVSFWHIVQIACVIGSYGNQHTTRIVHVYVSPKLGCHYYLLHSCRSWWLMDTWRESCWMPATQRRSWLMWSLIPCALVSLVFRLMRVCSCRLLRCSSCLLVSLFSLFLLLLRISSSSTTFQYLSLLVNLTLFPSSLFSSSSLPFYSGITDHTHILLYGGSWQHGAAGCPVLLQCVPG